jgi:hypothetical protein
MDGGMMRKPSFLTILFIWLVVSAGCVNPQPVVEYPPVDQLLIDESPFPEGWVATEPGWEHPPRAPWSGPTKMVEYIDRGFYTHSGDGAAAGISIRQFDSSRAAAKEYKHRVDAAFRIRDEKMQTPWKAPQGLSFESSEADRYRYGCSEVFGQPKCAYVAQYEVYVIDFHSSIYDTDVITYNDFLPVFQAIDKQMEQHLGER